MLWKTAMKANWSNYSTLNLRHSLNHCFHLFWSSIWAGPRRVSVFFRDCSAATLLTYLRLLLKYRYSVDQLLLNIQTRMIKKIKLLKIFKSSGNFLFVFVWVSFFLEQRDEKKEEIKQHNDSKAIKVRAVPEIITRNTFLIKSLLSAPEFWRMSMFNWNTSLRNLNGQISASTSAQDRTQTLPTAHHMILFTIVDFSINTRWKKTRIHEREMPAIQQMPPAKLSLN